MLSFSTLDDFAANVKLEFEAKIEKNKSFCTFLFFIFTTKNEKRTNKNDKCGLTNVWSCFNSMPFNA